MSGGLVRCFGKRFRLGRVPGHKNLVADIAEIAEIAGLTAESDAAWEAAGEFASESSSPGDNEFLKTFRIRCLVACRCPIQVLPHDP